MAIDKGMNVLIVDDYKTMLRIIRNLLKQIEFNNVEEASDGGEALAKLRSGSFVQNFIASSQDTRSTGNLLVSIPFTLSLPSPPAEK